MTDIEFSFDPVLEARLVDLGHELAVPTAESLLAAVQERVAADASIGPLAPVGSNEQSGSREPNPSSGASGSSSSHEAARSHRWRLLVAAVVVVLVALGGLVAYEPTRSAMAGWLGLGAVLVARDAALPPEPVPGGGAVPGGAHGSGSGSLPGTRAPGSGTTVSAAALAAAQREVTFPIRVPDPARFGAPLAVETDPSAPAGLVSLRFDRFTITEIAAQPGQRPVVGKFVAPDVHLELVSVNGRDGVWIAGGPHEVAYVDPDGRYRVQSVRRAGDVLVWEDGGVTYRVEGAATQADALAVAAALA